jgi:hypothetical protein
MTYDQDRRAAPPQPRSATIGSLMWIIVAAAVYLALLRPGGMAIDNLATVLGIILLVPWLLAPLTIKLRHWNSPHPQIEACDPLAVEEPEEFAESARELELAMADLGFCCLGYYRLTKQVPGCESLVLLFANESEKQTAKWLTVMFQSGPLRKMATSLLFTTDFTDGTRLATSNNLLPSPFPRIRVREGTASFPAVRGPRRLCEIHRACIKHFCGDAIRVLPTIKDPAEFLRQSIGEELAKFAESGYLYLDDKLDVYRPTWIGAYLIGWKLLWPLKPIRAMIRRRRAARLLLDLGFST